MFYTQTTFIGVDPTAGQKPFAYAALDSERKILALGQGDMDEILAFVAGQRQAFVAVCAPRRANLGLLEQESIRQALSPVPRPGRWVDFRVAEYLLRQHNISTPQTCRIPSECPRWMQMGFKLHRRLEALGYAAYPCPDEPLQCLEVYPHAAFTALLERPPFPKHTLEGRLQRQLVLHEQGLAVPDAMDFFEEITRHRLLRGMLPYDQLYQPAELDALAAAYTAWLAAVHPDQTCCLGSPEEGQIVLPVAHLKDHY
jgi:hypothetical protein